jgi:hypothetical protein
MNSLYLIAGLFALGALIGMYLLSLILRNKQTPKLVSFIHGIFVAAALVLLIFYAVRHGPGLVESIVLMVMAAIGGIVIITRDLTGKTLPKWLTIGHGLIAIAGFALLLIYMFGK